MGMFRKGRTAETSHTIPVDGSGGSPEFFGSVDDLSASRHAREEAAAAARKVARQAAETAVNRVQAAGREFGVKARALGIASPPGGWTLDISYFYGFKILVRAEGDAPVVCDGYTLDADALLRMIAKSAYNTSEGFTESTVRAMANILVRV